LALQERDPSNLWRFLIGFRIGRFYPNRTRRISVEWVIHFCAQNLCDEVASMLDLERQLLMIDAESGWTSEEVQAPDGELQRVKKFLKQVLFVLHRFYPELSHSYVSLAGLSKDYGWFEAVTACNVDPDEIPPTLSMDDSTPVGRALLGGEPIVRIEPSALGHGQSRPKLLIKLEAVGEFFGFICLVGSETEAFDQNRYKSIWDALPVLSRTIADAVFSMRLRTLAAPFKSHNGDDPLQSLLQEIVERTALGFAADGAVLRLYEQESGLLKVRASCGDIKSDLLADERIGIGLIGRVFAEPEHAWALSMPGNLNPDNSDTRIFGLEIPTEDKQENEDAGLRSYIVMRLTSEGGTSAQESPRVGAQDWTRLGTLSFFHCRPHRFSWREIAAFKSYCQRVADTISLRLTNDRLEETIEKLRLQNLALTRVEIVALLAHDLYHKAFSACKDVDDYINRCRKSMNDRKVQQTHEHLEIYATRARDSTLTFQHAIDQIRKLYKTTSTDRERNVDFELKDVVDDIQKMISGALERNNIEVEATYRGAVRINGPRSVMFQALFNLVINSIDSVRSRKTQRTLYIHIHASLEQLGAKADQGGKARRVVIQFWDDGPGIDRQRFPDAQKIFDIGETSKTEGTGTGLPVARSLLGRYFDGQLLLEDRKDARFRIIIPVR
jgi:signal transduction histidine kinase